MSGWLIPQLHWFTLGSGWVLDTLSLLLNARGIQMFVTGAQKAIPHVDSRSMWSLFEQLPNQVLVAL